MALATVKSLFHRHSTMLTIIPILATTLTLASGFLPLYSTSYTYTQVAGIPLPWKTTISKCSILHSSNPPAYRDLVEQPVPCPASFELSINWFYLASDVLIYTSVGFSLIPVIRKPRTMGTLVAVIAGIIAIIITSIPVFHDEVGTGYPTVYDKYGFPLPWLTLVTGNIACAPGFRCPFGPQAKFNWVSLAFDTSLYVAIASVTLFILKPQFFNTLAKPSLKARSS